MWLYKRRYNNHNVWSGLLSQRRSDEPAWETAARALYDHAYVHANMAGGQVVCYEVNRRRYVCYIIPIPKGSTWPTAGHDAQWFSTLPDNLHPHLWRSSPMGPTLDECAGRVWVTYACHKEGNVAQAVACTTATKQRPHGLARPALQFWQTLQGGGTSSGVWTHRLPKGIRLISGPICGLWKGCQGSGIGEVWRGL